METFSKGNKNSAKSSDIRKRPVSLGDAANGSLDYLNVQDQMASKDSAKLKKGGFKDGRYGI